MSANQSRRRTDVGLGPVSSTRPKIDNTLPYPGRELDKDSMRLVEIQPAAHESEPVVCTLSEVTFGSKPKFEALSYMWGTESAEESISLNDVPWEVGRNLLDALRFLRRQVAYGKAHQPFWIDFISINQSNVEERNRQLRIMDQIYFRASTVVVWLGSGCTEFQRGIIGELEAEKGEKGEQDSSQDSNSIQQKLVRYLRTDPYWDRLWILQEIGSAKMLRVCFGNESSSWEQFMDFIAMHNSDGSTGPLRLNRLLRQEKYNDSHTLKRLLEEHREAKCAEPLDKVYGLVGLASDAAQFPMDYSKSLYEVWKDTMVFMNCRGLFKEESQILPIGALVKSLLMANNSDPRSQISREHEDRVDSTQLIDNPNSVLVFHLKAVPLGCIIHVGPLAIDVISRPSEALEWRSATQQLFPADEMGQARREHDRLLSALLGSDESEVEMQCFNRPSAVVWKDSKDPRGYPASAREYVEGVQSNTEAIVSTLSQMPQQTTDRLASVQPRLYLAKRRTYGTPRKMGIASGLVQPGDLVCWVRSSKRALLVRVIKKDSWNTELRVFGTALATEDVCSSVPDYAKRWNSLKDEWSMEVQLDAGTIFMLLD
jgi:hypothetical protein